MKKPAIKQTGRIIFEGVEATKFWLRTFDQQKTLDMALDLVMAKPRERESISCPIISEYVVDERLKFVYVILAEVDILGICGGTGMILYTSPEREQEVYQERDALADDVVKSIKENDKPHEVIVIEEGKEKGRN